MGHDNDTAKKPQNHCSTPENPYPSRESQFVLEYKQKKEGILGNIDHKNSQSFFVAAAAPHIVPAT